ncbi:MAG: Ig-like domain-containing protein, partial [Prevotella sp.]|nr:Ig-like domain-containing protein [Prevotella sp.]
MMRSITSFARRVTGDSASQRKWLMLRLVMLLFTAMTTSATWADTATFTFGETGSNPDSGITSSDGNITLKSSGLDVYKNGLVTKSNATLTITSAEGKNAAISKVSITCAAIKAKGCFSSNPQASSTDFKTEVNVFTYTTAQSSIVFTRSENNTTVTKIEVEYTTSGGGSDVTDKVAPTFTLTTPSSDTDVAVNTTIVLTASEEVSKVGENITATLNGESITGTLDDVDKKTITFTPSSNLSNGTDYTITLPAGQVKDAANNNNAQASFTFKTVAAAEPETPSGPTIFDFTKGTDPGTTIDGITIGGGSYSKGFYNFSTTSGKLTLSSEKTITKVVITYTEKKDDRTGGFSSVTANVGNYSYDENVTGTWVGTSKDIEISFTDKARITNIQIFYTTLPTPVLSFANAEVSGYEDKEISLQAVTIATTDTEGNAITAENQEAIKNAITYSIDNDNIATISGSTLTLLNVGEATITATFAG